jgi:hypothetical protein
MGWFDEVITPEEREEIEASVRSINATLNRCRWLCEGILQFIDARMGGHEGEA